MVLLALALSCAAPEAERTEAWAVQRWGAEPAAVVEVVAAEADPVRRLALVLAVSEAHPGQALALCEHLAQASDRSYCESLHARPHLRPRTREPDPRQVRPLGVEGLLAPWSSVAPEEVPCASSAQRRACQSQAAAARARAGEAEGAAGLCAAVEASTWRDECLFLASEAAVEGGHVTAAAHLCLATGAVRRRCFGHLVRTVHARAPTGAPGDAAAWAPTAATVEELRAAVGGGAAGDEVAARVWARSLRRSYRHATRPTGAPLHVLPAEAAPFVRAAAAERLWFLEGRAAGDLDAWVQRLEAALADPRSPGVGEAGPDHPDRLKPWFEPGPAERPLVTATWYGPVSRALGPTPRSELAIVLLEAAVRTPEAGGAQALVVEGLDHPVAEVRWTAARALGVLDPAHPALEPLLADPDPRVAARAAAVRALAAPIELVEVLPPPPGSP